MAQESIDGLVTEASQDRQALQQLRRFLHEKYGIFFDDENLYSLHNKIRKRIRELPVSSCAEYESYLENHPEEVPRFLDVVSTNKTEFFRERAHWRFLKNTLIPRWQSSQETIKLWSAACSTGEEAYTLAMMLEEYLTSHSRNGQGQGALKSYRTGNVPEDNYKILASDLSSNCFRRARRGTYDARNLRQIRSHDHRFADKFFNNGGSNIEVVDELKDKITFRTFNLKTEQYPFDNDFHLILCRNVLIYFDDGMVQHVIDQITRCLKENGYLFIGHTESLHAIDHDLTKVKPAVFQK